MPQRHIRVEEINQLPGFQKCGFMLWGKNQQSPLELSLHYLRSQCTVGHGKQVFTKARMLMCLEFEGLQILDRSVQVVCAMTSLLSLVFSSKK